MILIRIMSFMSFLIGVVVNVADIYIMSTGDPSKTMLAFLLKSVMVFGWWPGSAVILWLAPTIIGLIGLIAPNSRLNRPHRMF